MSLVRWTFAILSASLLATVAACSARSRGDDGVDTIRVTGSDTMVVLTNGWREAFNVDHPAISVTVRGGGSGVGIANLCAGKIEIATASRPMKPSEIETAQSNTGKVPKEFIVARDALAIYVHRKNPLDKISIAELADVYGENGTITDWKQLGVDNTACSNGKIIRISRQNSSGTYAYFKEAVLGKDGEYKQGYTAQTGSADIVALVSNTPCAIGYSGMGYRDEKVKVLSLSKNKGDAPVEPTVATVQDGTYPISRPLYMYTLGEPTGAIQEFIQWVLSAEGQKIVLDTGYVPAASTQPATPQNPAPATAPEPSAPETLTPAGEPQPPTPNT